MSDIKRIIDDQVSSINYHTVTHPAPVEISEIQDDHVLVNGKQVYKDINGNWIAREELTTNERREFSNYINRVKGGSVGKQNAVSLLP